MTCQTREVWCWQRASQGNKVTARSLEPGPHGKYLPSTVLDTGAPEALTYGSDTHTQPPFFPHSTFALKTWDKL
jgi:hypothetical protein